MRSDKHSHNLRVISVLTVLRRVVRLGFPTGPAIVDLALVITAIAERIAGRGVMAFELAVVMGVCVTELDTFTEIVGGGAGGAGGVGYALFID